MPVLDPGHGRTMTGRLWCSASGNRPWRGPGYPAAYIFSKDRKSEHSACHLKGFRGVLQVDGYAGFGRLVTAAGNDMPQLAFSWAQTRGKFYDIQPPRSRGSLGGGAADRLSLALRRGAVRKDRPAAS